MNKGFARQTLVKTGWSIAFVLAGLYTIHIAPALPGPDSTTATTPGAILVNFAGIVWFAVAAFVEAGTLCRLFERRLLQRKSPRTFHGYALMSLGLVTVSFFLWAVRYIFGATGASRLIFLMLVLAWAASLAGLQWANTAGKTRRR